MQRKGVKGSSLAMTCYQIGKISQEDLCHVNLHKFHMLELPNLLKLFNGKGPNI